MFNALGNFVNRFWLAILIGWVALAIGLKVVAPSWEEVALDGDFDYLPAESTSRRGLDLLQKAFPDEKVKSQIALVFARPNAPLDKLDRQYALDVADLLAHIDTNSEAKLEEIKLLISSTYGVDEDRITPEALLQAPVPDAGDSTTPPPATDAPTLGLTKEQTTELIDAWVESNKAVPPGDNAASLATVGDLVGYVNLPWADPSNRVWTEKTPVVGQMLLNNRRTTNASASAEPTSNLKGHAVMVVGRLTTDMMATENVGILQAVTKLVEKARNDPNKPEGLEIGLSGSAMIGGDMQSSVAESLKSTEMTTVILVFLCLITIYRSPLLVVIPMATIAISLSVASDVVALLAEYFARATSRC